MTVIVRLVSNSEGPLCVECWALGRLVFSQETSLQSLARAREAALDVALKMQSLTDAVQDARTGVALHTAQLCLSDALREGMYVKGGPPAIEGCVYEILRGGRHPAFMCEASTYSSVFDFS